MPQLLRIGPYIIYFWSNENMPLEPVHVHIAEGKASANATKLWITSTGKVIKSNNNSNIPDRVLSRIIRVVESNSKYIIDEWKKHLSEAQPHRKRIECVETGEIFDSFADAARKTGLNRTKIVSVCTGKRKKTGGLHFRYADKTTSS